MEFGMRNVEGGIAPADLEPGHYVRLTVRDTGQGIEPHIVDRIFEPYFTTKEVGKGTGMGLALVHGIVKGYGGGITVESEPGKGSSFHVYLPLVEADRVAAEVSKEFKDLPRGKERILFVDDEKTAVDAIQQMLEGLGYKVTARTSSIEALEAFRGRPDAFDLVITDMTMPNMTGKDLARELMTIRPDIPVIICTGFSEQIDERRAREMGISAFFMKPILIWEMAKTIREVLNPAPSKR
ncbi:MAG: response regulator [Pseudomonadota bacterium]